MTDEGGKDNEEKDCGKDLLFLSADHSDWNYSENIMRILRLYIKA